LNHQQNNQIPETGHTYKKYRIITDTCILIYKKIGFTPVQVLREIKSFINEEYRDKLTFVGRLDPMAEGYIHMLWSGDKEEKKTLTELDKEYTIDILFDIHTDTDDVLGLIESVNEKEMVFDKNILNKFVGPFEYNYPKYSSPHIKHVLKGNDFEYKKQDGYIYDIEFLDFKKYNEAEMKKIIFDKLALCQMEGDFRLEDIKISWKKFFKKNKKDFQVLTLKVKCRRGTYMRVLARELGGLALSIVRG
jgi:tRNA pseudouridine(55) synthase